jgi:hypothetical protein
MPTRSWLELEQACAEAQAAQYACWWLRADLCREAVEEHGATVAVVARVAGMSAAHVRRMVRAARTFAPEARHPDVPPSAYLAALRAPDPVRVVEQAQAEGLSAAGVADAVALGETPDPDADLARLLRAADRYANRQRPSCLVLRVEPGGNAATVERRWPA